MLVVVIGRTLRIKLMGTIPEDRAIYAFWHGLFFPLIYAYRKYNITLMISQHRDGEYLAGITKPLGYGIIRGSSGETGAKGFLKLLKVEKSSFAFAPDGPVGPRWHFKVGMLKLAEYTGLPIIPVGIHISKKIIFGSWDHFNLPLPFSRCTIRLGSPVYVKKATEQMRKKVEAALLKTNTLAGL